MQFWRHRRREAEAIDQEWAATPDWGARVWDGPDWVNRAARAHGPPPRGPVSGPPDQREAFSLGLDRGRTEERSRHRSHPLLALMIAVIALSGAIMLALAAHEGSFSRAGAVMDQNLAAAMVQARTAGADLMTRTGKAAREAATAIHKKASDAASGNG